MAHARVVEFEGVDPGPCHDYKKGHEALDAMSAEDTPGRRSSVTKYRIAAHRTQ